ncbi:MAG: DNA-binding protein [Xanthobacteraceae bacterium]
MRLRTGPAAEYIGSTKSTLEKTRVTGTGPVFLKVGHLVFYDTKDLDEYLVCQRRSSTSDAQRPAVKRGKRIAEPARAG